jgi:hypothetical protein
MAVPLVLVKLSARSQLSQNSLMCAFRALLIQQNHFGILRRKLSVTESESPLTPRSVLSFREPMALASSLDLPRALVISSNKPYAVQPYHFEK